MTTTKQAANLASLNIEVRRYVAENTNKMLALKRRVQDFEQNVIPNEFINTQRLAKGSVKTDRIGFKAVTPNQVNFLSIISDNLYNPKDETNRKGYYIEVDGLESEYASFTVSHFIQVTAGEPYTPSEKQKIACFDANQNPIGGFDSTRSNATITPPAGCAYVKLSIPTDLITQFQFQKGTAIVNYDTYKTRLVGATDLDRLFKPTRQLFRKDDPGNILGYYMDTSGALTANANYTVSHFIPVVTGATYMPSKGGEFITFFDVNQKPLPSAVGMYNRATDEVVAISEAAYVRLTIPNSYKDRFMFEQSTVKNSFQPFGSVPTRELWTTPGAIGKRILWLGTSIPWGSGYVEAVAEMLGFTAFNMAYPSSALRISDRTGGYGAIDWQNVAYSLTMDLNEKEAFIQNWSTIRSQFRNAADAPLTLSATLQEMIRSTSYVYRLLPYLQGPNKVDAIVISHGYNDRPGATETFAQFTTMPDYTNDAAFRNRNSFLGASNYLIDVIRQFVPRMPIYIEGHYENVRDPAVAAAQQVLAAHYGFPLWPLWSKMGLSQQKIRGTQSLWGTPEYSQYSAGANTADNMTAIRLAMPDDVHPYSDSTGETGRKMALNIRNYMRDSL